MLTTMKIVNESNLGNLDKLCRKKLSDRSKENGSGGKLFEREWEVFVARFDKNTGKFVTGTYCCEDAISNSYDS